MDDVMKGLGAKGAGRDRRLCLRRRMGGAATRHAVDRFLNVTLEAKEILAASDADWQRLAPRIGATRRRALAIYRQRYREGISAPPIAEEEADAAALYRVLAEIGGADLVGPAKELDAGTFYRPAERMKLDAAARLPQLLHRGLVRRRAVRRAAPVAAPEAVALAIVG